MSKRTDDEKRRFWQPFIDHLNATWKAAAKKDCNYPFTGKDMADLRYHCGNFNEWGMMALWDKYLRDADDYVKKHGYDIFTFTRSLPRLLDSDWKHAARGYEQQLCGDLAGPLKEALKTTISKKLPTKPSKQVALLRSWARVKRLRAEQAELPGFA